MLFLLHSFMFTSNVSGMELKINIDGLERSVSGVTENTTCSQIIYALAHATSQRGRFVMVEKYRNVERRLAPNDRPLETLRKWREHAANVTFQMLRVDQNDAICDYMSVMEKKNIMMGATLPKKEDFENFERADVKKLSETMNQQEIADYLVQEEELRQLLKQQKNLRAILKPMISANWPQQYQLELKKSHKLKASLAATKEAISKTNSDIKRVEETERELLKKLTEFKKQDENGGDENSELSETSFDLGCPSTGTSTPQTLIA
ncbi:hypothetical protein CRE_00781 [Caenorhabditis remanei]|uniref:Ras association domain-containing protein n=1 Tax=Caenorhabditis remanei TaxID=31234 RepID=E3LEA1_CAERE|nr:hypothetical protein CRE_00781 [Caenorhabditis remanei]